MARVLAALGLALGLAVAPLAARAQEAPLGDHAARTVVVLVFDGFAPSLLAGISAPSFDRLRREGSFTSHMLPAFPTVSLVNGFTLSTGCWPGRHGIVANVFEDPKRGTYDRSADADWLLSCEGMHQAAERQGVRAAALGWYGAYSGTKGPQASVVSKGRTFEDYPADPERAQEVARLLKLPNGERPRLILAYFKGPDAAEHSKGVDSADAKEAARMADAAVGTVLAAIDAMPDRARVALIVTTDHGMVPVSTLVNLSKILANHGIHARPVSAGTTSILYFDDKTEVSRAEKELGQYKEFDVFRPTAQPAYAHLGDGPRIGDLVVSAHPPHFIEDPSRWPTWARWIATWGPEFFWASLMVKAGHGYPPETPGVAGILYARGAGFARGREVPSVNAIDLHPTVMHLLSIEPGKPVDGKVARELLE